MTLDELVYSKGVLSIYIWVEIKAIQFNGYISAADISKFTCFEIDTWYNDQLSSSLQLNFGLLGSFTILHASISDRAFS